MATVAHSYMMAFFDDGEPRSDLSPVGTFTFLDSGIEAPIPAFQMATATVIEVSTTIVAAARTFSRGAGDWTADLAVGDWVRTTGYVNGGNNTVGKIATLTALVMTLENRPTLSLVDETSAGAVTTKLVPGVFIVLGAPASQVSLMWDAFGGGVGSLINDSRYKFTPTGPDEPYASNPILGAAMSGLAMVAGSVGEAIRAAASTLYTRLEARTFDDVNNKKVVDYIETAYYTDDTFGTEVLRLEHTPTYDATTAVLEATSNEKT